MARAYYEARDRWDLDQPAYEQALSVYRGHFPSTSDGAARQVVAQIIAEASQERAR